ncbi:MAG: DNA replication and repair protein RecF [Leptospirales bacterium]
MPDSYFPVSLRKITLRSFRKYEKLTIDLNAPVVMITGRNGSGKTTILEAISMVSSLRSFRRASDKELIAWEKNYYSLELEYKGTEGVEVLKMGYGKAEKNSPTMRTMVVNGSRVKKISEFLGRFQTVVFSPEDLKIIEGPPAERRKYIDMVLSLLSPGYLDTLQKYRKALEMRGAILKKRGSQSYVSSIDRELAEYGSRIQLARVDFIQEFRKPFFEYIDKISGGEDQWNLAYVPSIAGGDQKEVYFNTLQQSYTRDIRYKQTMNGIHRDRFIIHLPDAAEKEIRIVASQGQKRTAALAMRMAQYRHTQEKTHETPVILIDDVLTELDTHRRNGFIRFMNDVGQALITLTDTSGIQDYITAGDGIQNMLVYETGESSGQIQLQAIKP